MARTSRNRKVSFRNYALLHTEMCCFSKVEPVKDELVFKHGPFRYKGIDFLSPWHVGILPECNTEKLGHDLDRLDHIWFITNEWQKVKFYLIQWLNQCNSMADIAKLLPEAVTEKFSVDLDGEITITDEWLDMVHNSPEFTMLETLVFTNEILEQ